MDKDCTSNGRPGTILRSYRTIKEADIEAALAYAAELAREGTVNLPLEIKGQNSGLEIQDRWLKRRSPEGQLWIVQADRIRIRE